MQITVKRYVCRSKAEVSHFIASIVVSASTEIIDLRGTYCLW